MRFFKYCYPLLYETLLTFLYNNYTLLALLYIENEKQCETHYYLCHWLLLRVTETLNLFVTVKKMIPGIATYYILPTSNSKHTSVSITL